jgi:hypothetical protein
MHLGVNMDKKVFGCLKCGYSGHLDQLKRKYSLVISNETIQADYKEKLVDITLTPLENECWDYLARRGIPHEDVIRWGLRSSVELPYRVIFTWPSNEYYAARAILPDMSPKYIHPAVPKRDKIYGLWKIDRRKPVAIVEGPFDALRTPNAVALLGHNLSDEQCYILNQTVPGTKIVYMDPDVTYVELRSFFKLTGDVRIVPTMGRIDDPGSMTKERNQLFLETAERLETASWLH